MGILTPNIFLPLVEESGMNTSVGEWVLRRACAEVGAWNREQDFQFGIAINILPGQTQDDLLPKRIRGALSGAKIDPRRLILEVSERGVHPNLRHVGKVLGNCRELGVRVALDDFGMGNSSMRWLREFPVDILKVDGSFIQRMPYSSRDHAIVTSLVEMAQRLGLQSIAEGIETEEQYECALQTGCSAVQGYLHGRPSPNLALRSTNPPAEPAPGHGKSKRGRARRVPVPDPKAPALQTKPTTGL
jgi:EAL domain-containing protein (putative c-di-GMP-specific phosphodiesterase class I)